MSDPVPTTDVDSVAGAAALLYGVPLGEFVARRDALVKAIRAGGDRSLANEIKALRKPTVVADALNRALRHDPGAIDALLGAVEELRRTQEAMLSGSEGEAGDGSNDFAGRQADYRAAIEAVVANAPGHELEVRQAVEAAAIGGRGEDLRAASFALPPEPGGGLGPFAPGAGTVLSGTVLSGTVLPSTVLPGSGRAASQASDPSRTDGDDGVERGADDAAGRDQPPARPSAAERRMAERARRAAEQAVASAETELHAARDAARRAGRDVTALEERIEELGRPPGGRPVRARRRRRGPGPGRGRGGVGRGAPGAGRGHPRRPVIGSTTGASTVWP